MARFDKKWLFVHVPASVAVVALLAFGVVQCDGKKEEAIEKTKAQNQLVDASKKMEIAASRMDSLLNVNRDLGADNVRKGDTIRVLKDSVNVLNGKIVELRTDNDSLIIALDDCANSKKSAKPAQKKKAATRPAATRPAAKPSQTPRPQKSPDWKRPVDIHVPQQPQPSGAAATEVPVRRANVTVNGSYNNGNVIVDNAPAEANIRLENGAINNGNVVVGGANTVGTMSAQQATVAVEAARNNGNVIVENGARNTDVSLGNNAVNNGAIVVGNANTVYHVTPDTIMRFTAAKNTVVKCRIITKQRQYR